MPRANSHNYHKKDSFFKKQYSLPTPACNTRAKNRRMRLDLWNTTLTHLCTLPEQCPAVTCNCICCLRPILRHSLHTRTFQWYDNSMHTVLARSKILSYCPIYREQVILVLYL